MASIGNGTFLNSLQRAEAEFPAFPGLPGF